MFALPVCVHRLGAPRLFSYHLSNDLLAVLTYGLTFREIEISSCSKYVSKINLPNSGVIGHQAQDTRLLHGWDAKCRWLYSGSRTNLTPSRNRTAPTWTKQIFSLWEAIGTKMKQPKCCSQRVHSPMRKTNI